MNRREATYAIIAAAFGAEWLGIKAQQPKGPAGLEVKDFHLSYNSNSGIWDISGGSLTVGGIDYPVNSWGWIALNLAQGVISAIGGMIFTAVANQLLSQGQPQLSELLQQQLVQIANMLSRAFAQHDLSDAQINLATNLDLTAEYVRSSHGKGGRLEYLIPNTDLTLHRLEALGLPAYPTYLQAAALRLALLQDLAAKEGGGSIMNFIEQQRRIEQFHRKIADYIVEQTDPTKRISPTGDGDIYFGGYSHRQIDIFGVPIQGFVHFERHADGLWHPLSAESARPAPMGPTFWGGDNGMLDWLALRRNIKIKTIDPGEPIVRQMLAAKPKLTPIASRQLTKKWA